jgi:hypothetical protein
MLYACSILLPVNHAYQLQLATATTKKPYFFPYKQFDIFAMLTAMCRIFIIGRIFGSIFLPNIRFRPKQENPFSVDHYPFDHQSQAALGPASTWIGDRPNDKYVGPVRRSTRIL